MRWSRKRQIGGVALLRGWCRRSRLDLAFGAERVALSQNLVGRCAAAIEEARVVRVFLLD